ncbi:MAG: YncE family protein [Bacteroidota bacterium]|nr:YncE family protein [Bacteroidota bacterium]MDP4229184.1 YncE family protein [Bacteroidota bacterium]MDP4235504.1 YncE family protein [Bacteroidota bacterium]
MRHIALLILFCLAVSSCKTTSTGPTVVDNFPSNVSSIIQANCLGGDCHSGPTPQNTHLTLSSWDAMTKGSVYFNEVIPFTAVKSHLFGHVNTNSNLGPVIIPTMPLARNPLSDADQATIFTWINQGAKSAQGKVPYDDVTKRIFIANQSENMLSVVDADTKRLVRILSAGTGYLPAAIEVMPDFKSCIVAMAGANGIIRKYDIATYSQLGEFKSNLVPSEIALTPDGSKGYVTDESYAGNRFGVFDPVSMTMSKTISSPLIIDPFSVAVSPDGKYAYICGHGSDNVLRIDTKNDSVMGCLPLGADVIVPVTSKYVRKYLPQKVVVSSDSKTLYVTCNNTHEVVVFDLVKDTIKARIPVNNFPWGEALSPDGSELWVVTWGTNSIHVISTSTNQLITEIDSVSQNPHAVTITPDGAFAYVACEFSAGGAHHHETGGLPESSYVVIDCKTRKIISIQELPAYSIDVKAAYK